MTAGSHRCPHCGSLWCRFPCPKLAAAIVARSKASAEQWGRWVESDGQEPPGGRIVFVGPVEIIEEGS